MKSKAFASGKLLLVTALAAITLGIGAAAAKDLPPLPEAIASKGVLRVGTKCDYPPDGYLNRSEEHTSELQSLMRISYAVFCLTKKTSTTNTQSIQIHSY